MPSNVASIAVALAVPVVTKSPRHPRGESKCPVPPICPGGSALGTNPMVEVVVTGTQLFWDRMVVRKVCRPVPGMTSKVHVVGPVMSGWLVREMVRVPFQGPFRNDASPEGEVGEGCNFAASVPTDASCLVHSGDDRAIGNIDRCERRAE